MISRKFSPRTSRFLSVGVAVLAGLVCCAPFAHAQYQIGSSTTAVADPPIVRPTTTPCVVNLFTNDEFDNFNNMPFNFTPPAGCPGPYAKIVLTGDYYITSGVQYDRTSQVFLNNVNIFFGTTPEPINVNDPWHFERDLTDYAALFKTAGAGFASLGNEVNSTYTGIIYGTVNVLFYPANAKNPAPASPDYIVSLLGPQGGTVQLNASTPQVNVTGTVPPNTERLYVDIVAQSQNDEEQWFTCLPADQDDLSIDGCPNTAFREVELTIDGVPAGVAPVSPWIYTGGLDPYLWLPIPGAQTLNFTPYRVDLSPFAGAVSDGQPHTLGIELYNAYEYFTVTASMLVYEDHGSAHTSGSILTNTLTAPDPAVTENVNTDPSGNISGNVLVTSNRSFDIVGQVNTSHGMVTHAVEGNISFSNNSALTATETFYEQAIQQQSTVDTISSGYDAANGGYSSSEQNWSFPINLTLAQTANSDGSYTQYTESLQTYSNDNNNEGSTTSQYLAHNRMSAQDILQIVPCSGGYCIGGNSDQKSSQTYFDTNYTTACYYQSITAANNVLTGASALPDCSREYGGPSATRAPAPRTTEVPHLGAVNLKGPMMRTAEGREK